jgi:hypothetical protein
VNRRAVWLGMVVGLVFGVVLASCRFDGAFRARRITGTCEGACDRYLSCKHSGDPAARNACVSECRDVFQDQDSLRAFESLECPDVIEYVEGDTGQGPGQMVGGTHR